MTSTSKTHKILLTEDDEFISRAYKDGLERAGFIVFTAYDGEEAIESLRNDKPDIMLLDLIMPNKNGFEVLEEMGEDKDLRKIPVVILSNLGQDSDIERGKKLGAIDYIIKSDFSMKEMIDRVCTHISNLS